MMCNEVELIVVLLNRNVVCLFTFGTRSKIRTAYARLAH